MSLIPIAIVIIKFSICLAPLLFGIRCLFVTEPQTDNFVYDIRNMFHIRGMSRRRWWVSRGLFLMTVGIALTYFILIAPNKGS